MKNSQPPQLKEFVIILKCGNETKTRTLVSTSKEAAIKAAKDIVKYAPGPRATVVDAKEKG